MIRNFAAALLIVFGAIIGVSAQEKFVKPVDEGASDPSFAAFRKKLLSAVERKDNAYILTIVDPKIKNGFGGNDGIAEFKKQWKNSDEFWREFSAVIKGGGQFTADGAGRKNSFMAPYLFTAWPEGLDAFEYSAVFGNDVNLREKPDANSKVLTKLSYNVVKVDQTETRRGLPDDEDPKWVKIETLGGIKGWMSAPYVRSSIDYRAGFEKIRGVWKLTFFLAGD
jgi:hypothetical protein